MIYFDNASTTRCSDESVQIITNYASKDYFNPSSAYKNAIEIKNDIENARKTILKSLRAADDSKLIFTSSGTESDNLAIFGCRKSNKSRIIISASEHAAVYNSAMELRNRGFDVCLCPVDSMGVVDCNAFSQLVSEDTSLISIIHSSNETGGVNDIKTLCSIAKAANPKVIFHSDGVQAFGKIPVDVTSLGVDLYSVSGHKINAPKGIGALYVRKGLHINPILFGGGQENGLRSSTENVGGILALANMAAFYTQNQEQLALQAGRIKSTIIASLSEISELIFISDTQCAAVQNIATQNPAAQIATQNPTAQIATGQSITAQNAAIQSQNATTKDEIIQNVAVPSQNAPCLGKSCSDYVLTFSSCKVRGEVMQHALEREGILIGTGSACSSSKASRRIATAIGLTDKYLDGVIRLSFGRYNTTDEAAIFVESFIRHYKELSKYGN